MSRGVTDFGATGPGTQKRRTAAKETEATRPAQEGPVRLLNSQHRAIRASLQSMSPRRAEMYIKAFRLRDEESAVLILGDIRGMSAVQVANKLHLSTEVVKRRRRAAYSKIQDAIENEGSRGD